jgi:hypothetical protein
MSSLIRIENDFGTTLIDDTSPTLGLRQKLTATSVYLGLAEIYAATGALTSNFKSPVFAVSGTNRFYCYGASAPTPGVYPYGVLTTFSGYTFTFYHFDYPTGTLDSARLEIRNEANEVMFHSGQKPAIVYDTVILGPSNSWTTTKTYEVGKKFAVIVVGVWCRIVNNVVYFEGRDETRTYKPTGNVVALVIDVTLL